MRPLKKTVAVFLLTVFVPLSIYPQQTKNNKSQDKKDAQKTPEQPAATPRPALEFGLSEDTPVRIKLTRTMSSKDAKLNEKVDFEVIEDVKVKDTIVIKQGAMAIATVTKAEPKKSMGRAGKLDMNIDYVQLVDGEKVPLRASKGGSGGSHTGAMTGAMVATGILFFPAAPLFLFMKGKNITVPQGTEVTAYVAADTPLDASKFSQEALASPATATTNATTVSSVTVKSVPDAAEITVDDKFVGTTPSTLKLSPGEHKIVVSKAGFKSWERTMTVNANGNVNLSAELEKNP